MVAFGIGVATGAVVCFMLPVFGSVHISEECLKTYEFTADSISCEEYEESYSRMKVLDEKLSTAAKEYEKNPKITRLSIWTRDLKTRQWAAYKEHERYIPASLMKVPLMVAYLHLAELNPTVLTSSIVYKQSDETNGQYMPPSNKLIPGASYTVEALVEQMIKYSDNDVMRLLIEHLDAQLFTDTLTDLGLQIITDSDILNFVTVKTYANVFRVLYNASYLNREFSEKALTLLASTEYKGIAEPLPSSVTVAHKFGERGIEDAQGNTKTIQLHDCGIVYTAKRDYSLCIMTEGHDLELQKKINREISKLVYNNI